MANRKKKTRFTAPELGRAVSRRPARVGDAIRNEIAILLLRDLKDPRLSHVNITSVDVSPDLRHAKVYFSCGDDLVQEAIAGFASAKGFIRSTLAKILTMRFMPELNFIHDMTSARHAEMGKLFMEIENDRKKPSE